MIVVRSSDLILIGKGGQMFKLMTGKTYNQALTQARLEGYKQAVESVKDAIKAAVKAGDKIYLETVNLPSGAEISNGNFTFLGSPGINVEGEINRLEFCCPSRAMEN